MRIPFYIILLLGTAISCSSPTPEASSPMPEPAPITNTSIDSSKTVQLSLPIPVSPGRVWVVITALKNAKELGAVFDKDAWIRSDYKLGSTFDFVYGEDKVVSSGVITKLSPNKLIHVDYDFDGFHYFEEFVIEENAEGASLGINAGPYGEDYTDQQVVWGNWLKKVSEISLRAE